MFEALMLVCFGISWPISISKALKTKVVRGKSPIFMGVICLGYICGILHKVRTGVDWKIWLYALNFVFVAFDLILYYKYLPNLMKPEADLVEKD